MVKRRGFAAGVALAVLVALIAAASTIKGSHGPSRASSASGRRQPRRA